jgi:hypothetical protein
MEIVHENRKRAWILLLVFGLLGLYFLFELWKDGANLFAGLWISIKLVLALGVAFFALQNIFYKRTLRFAGNNLVFKRWGMGSLLEKSEELSKFYGLDLKWVYSRIPKIPPRLELRLNHPLPEWKLELIIQDYRESTEAFLDRVRILQQQSGLAMVEDESGLWKA